MKWDTQDTDVDLMVLDPNGSMCPVLEDVRRGPGREVCIVQKPEVGDYALEARYYGGPRKGQPTPVTAEAYFGRQLLGTYPAVLQREGDQQVLQTIRVGKDSATAVAPEKTPAPVPREPLRIEKRPAPERPRPEAAPNALVVVMRWEAPDTNVDLLVTAPNGQRCQVLDDVTRGPGQEACVVTNPVAGQYRIEVLCAAQPGGQAIPVTVEVRVGGRLEGAYKATLTRRDERCLVHTLRF
jgi:hypothetical protein